MRQGATRLAGACGHALVDNGRLSFREKRIPLFSGLCTLLFLLVWIFLGYSLSSDVWMAEFWHRDGLGKGKTRKILKNGTKIKTNILKIEDASKRRTGYCERFGGTEHTSGFMAEPANALSNYAFCFYGFIILAAGIQDYLDQKISGYDQSCMIVNYPLWSLIIALGLFYLGCGSFIFHASITRLGQTLDVAAIYTILFKLTVCYLARFFRTSWFGDGAHGLKRLRIVHWILMVSTIFADFLFFLFKWNMKSAVVMISMIAVIIVLCFVHLFLYRTPIYKPFVAGAVVSIVIAYIFREADVKGWMCDPDSWFQGHACWHVLTATSYFCGYLILRSEGQMRSLSSEMVSAVGRNGVEMLAVGQTKSETV